MNVIFIDLRNVAYAVSSIMYKKFTTTGQNLPSWCTFWLETDEKQNNCCFSM